MNATIVVYGSSTGTCEAIAEKIARKLGCEAINVQDLTPAAVESHQNLILGTSTWGAGELQDDWYDGLKVLQGANLAGKTIALFGCGDCESYSEAVVNGQFVGLPLDDVNEDDKTDTRIEAWIAEISPNL